MPTTKWGRKSCLSFRESLHKKMIAPRSVTLTMLCLLAVTGCGHPTEGPARVEVTGTVTLNESPVEGANVLFSPDVGSDDNRLASQAVTDSQGRFKLSTHVGGGKFKSGIVPGKYVVTISKLD